MEIVKKIYEHYARIHRKKDREQAYMWDVLMTGDYKGSRCTNRRLKNLKTYLVKGI